ncbi:hypothetical protein AOLI_G00063560 [Acnodon oligacanthus]
MQRKGHPALSDLSEFPREKREHWFYIDCSGSQLKIECDSPPPPLSVQGHFVNHCIRRYIAPCPDLGDRRAADPLAECSRLWLINCETVALWDADTALGM